MRRFVALCVLVSMTTLGGLTETAPVEASELLYMLGPRTWECMGVGPIGCANVKSFGNPDSCPSFAACLAPRTFVVRRAFGTEVARAEKVGFGDVYLDCPEAATEFYGGFQEIRVVDVWVFEFAYYGGETDTQELSCGFV